MQKNFRICLICKLPGFREHRLCRHCARELRDLQKPVVREEDGFLIRSLFSWQPNDKRVFADLVYALKGQEDAGTWLELAIWMVDHFHISTKRAGLSTKLALLPIPGSGANHALGLARGLAIATEGTVVDVLRKDPKRSQKSLSRQERGQVSFTLADPHFHCRDYSTVLIVDDVITTGATVRAAFKALHRPKNCEVWCLMDRARML